MAVEVAGYHLRGPLVAGGTGPLYRAEAIGRPGRLVVLKQLGFSQDTPALAATVRAAERRRSIDHPHLLPLLDIVTTDTAVALVVPYAAGGSLADALARTPGGLPPGTVAGIGARIAAALDALHRHGCVHGAITPRAILFHADGRPLLAGFGPTHRDRPRPAGLPAAGSTPTLDPSLAAGGATDEVSDLHDLGVTLYECLSGQRPTTAGGATADANTTCAPDRSRPLSELADAPPWLTGAIEWAMAPDVADRPPTAAHLADLLGQFSHDATSTELTDATATGKPATDTTGAGATATGLRFEPVARAPAEERGRPRRFALVAAFALVLLVPLLVGLLASNDGLARVAPTASAPRPTAASDASRPALADRIHRADPRARELAPLQGSPPPTPACDDLDSPSGEGEVLLADLDGRGCPTPVRWDGTELTIPVPGNASRRFTLDADPDDQLLFADLACLGRDAPVLYRPATGEVFAFEGLVAPGGEVTVVGRPAGAIGGNATVVPGDDGCDRLEIVDPR